MIITHSIRKEKKKKYHQKGIEWYLQQFPNDNNIKGEISPEYMFDEKAASRIKQHFPHTKIIICLRDPVNRAYSQYKFASQTLYIASFTKAIRKYPEFIERSKYYKQLKKYYDLFPRKKIKIVLFEDIKNNPEKTIQEVESFLNVKKIIPANINKKSNVTKEIKYPTINKILTKVQKIKTTKIGRIIWKSKTFTKIKLKIIHYIKKINKKNTRPKELPYETKKEIYQQYFKEDIKKLEKLLNMNLSHWKYE